MILGWNGERFDGKMCSQYWHYAGICQIQYRLYYLVNLRGEKLNLFTLTGPLKSNFATREPRRSLFSILTLFDYFEHSITSRCLLILFVCVPWYMLCRTVDILNSNFNWFYPIKILQWKSLYDEYCYGENIHERFNINISLVLFF